MSSQSQKEIKSFPLPLFAGVLNAGAKTYRPSRPVVPRFTKEQMAKALRIQKEELEDDD